MFNWLFAASKAAQAKGGESKFGAIILIVIGIFLAPMLIGIPLLLFGVIKLFSSE
jgi:hypothetical protein